MLFNSLEFRDLDFFYHSDRPLLRDVSCQFPMNTSVWIKAPPSSGRSTLLKILALLVEPKGGDFLINDQSVNDMSFEESVALRLKMGYGFDSGGLLSNRTLRDNLMLAPVYHKVWSQDEARERAQTWLGKFGLSRNELHLPSAVSGGERKIVALIRALLMEPELLLLDEPTLGLNNSARMVLIEEIGLLRASGAVRHLFVVSSDEPFAAQITDQELLFQNQQLRSHSAKESA